ncbi:MAG TPA: response regulator [Acidobacteriaceae bacterium]|nr:response regulator [Acidobacteriaceae bacterium]
MKRRILLVDDEPAILLTLKALLDIHGFDVETASSARDAKAKLRNSTFHMVITDMRMENNEAGLEVARAAKAAEYQPAVALLTAFPMSDDTWREEGADEMLVKPMNSHALIRQLEALLVAHEDRKRPVEKVSTLAASEGKERRKSAARTSAVRT